MEGSGKPEKLAHSINKWSERELLHLRKEGEITIQGRRKHLWPIRACLAGVKEQILPRENLNALGDWGHPNKAKHSHAHNWECTSQYARVVTL